MGDNTIDTLPCIEHGFQSAECAVALEGKCAYASLQPDPVSGGTISRSVLLDARSPCMNFYRDVLARGNAAPEARRVLSETIRDYCTGPGRNSMECDCANFNSNYAEYCGPNACSHATLSSTEGIFPMCWVSSLYFRNACGGATSGQDAAGIPCNAAGGSQSFIEFTSCAAGGKTHTSGNSDHNHEHSDSKDQDNDDPQTSNNAIVGDNQAGCGAVCNPHVCWYQPCLGSTYYNLLTPDMYDYVAKGRCASVCFQSVAQETIAVGSTPLPGQAWQVGQNILNCGGTRATGAQLVTLLPAAANNTWTIQWSKNAQTTASLPLFNAGGAIANWSASLSGLPSSVTLVQTLGTFPPGATLPLYLEADQAAIAALDDNMQLSGSVTLTYPQDPAAPDTSDMETLTVPIVIDVLADQPYEIVTQYVEVPSITRNAWTWGIVAIVAILVAGLLLILVLRAWSRPRGTVSPSGHKTPHRHHHGKHQQQQKAHGKEDGDTGQTKPSLITRHRTHDQYDDVGGW